MKRSTDSSCSSPSSSDGSSTITVSVLEKPIKIKRSRKSYNLQPQCHNTTGKRSSIYRGVTRHRWTGRFEAHLWDKTSWNNIQNKKGRQVYLGAYDNEEAAAHTYDLAALKYWGPETTLNFPIETYGTEVEEMKRASKEEYLASLRRQSSGFSRGVSKYRGVARHHHNGRWEARIGRVFGNKYLYLGTYSFLVLAREMHFVRSLALFGSLLLGIEFDTEEEAAAAYDMAAIEHRGPNAVTNFDISKYMDRLKDKGNGEGGEVEAEVDQQPAQHIHQENQETVNMEEEKVCEGEMLAEYGQLMSPCNMDELELSWSFCMDAGGFSPPPLPNNLLPGELPDLFDDSGFVDNIDFIFDSADLNDTLMLSPSTNTLFSCNYSV